MTSLSSILIWTLTPPHNYTFLQKFCSFLNRVNDRLRKMLNLSPKDWRQDIEKRFYDFGECLCLQQCGSICMHGKELIRQFTFNPSSGKSHDETGVRGIWKVDIGTIRWDFSSVSNQLGKFPWKQFSLVNNEEVVTPACKGLCILRFCVCLGKMNQNLTSNDAWENRLSWFKNSPQYRAFDTIDGEQVDFEWNFPRMHYIGACPWSPRVQEFTGQIVFMSMFNDSSGGFQNNEQFQGRIIFMSMFIWGKKDNETESIANSTLVSLITKRFPAGRWWSFLWPGSETKWCSIKKDKEENGIESLNWWSNSPKAYTQLSKPRVRCLEDRSKAKEVENYPYTSVPMVIRLKLFSNNFSVNQLSIYGVSDLCEKYGTCQTSTRRPVLAEQSDPLFAPSIFLKLSPWPLPVILA